MVKKDQVWSHHVGTAVMSHGVSSHMAIKS